MNEPVKKKSKLKRFLIWSPIVLIVWVVVAAVEEEVANQEPKILGCNSTEVRDALEGLIKENTNLLFSNLSSKIIEKNGDITKCVAKMDTNMGEHFAFYSFQEDRISLENVEQVNAITKGLFWSN